MQVTTNSLLGLQQNNEMRLHFRNAGTATERLSSGLRINKGADDPSGLGITSGMRATIGGLEQAIENAMEGLKMLQTSDAALSEINDLLERGYELSVRAANFATFTSSDRDKMQDEVDALLSQIDSIANTCEFNGKKLLNGGSGERFQITTQADWQAGSQFDPAAPPNRLDTTTTPGDLKLAVRPYDDGSTANAYKWTPQGNNNDYYVCMYYTNFTDLGDGTADVEITFRTERKGGGATYKGSIYFDPGIVDNAAGKWQNPANGGSSVNYVGGGRYDFTLRSTTAPTDRVSIQFNIPMTAEAQDFRLEIDSPTNRSTTVYFGNDTLAGGPDVLAPSQLPQITTIGYLSDVYDRVVYRSAPITTNTTGGTATLNYNSATSAGTSSLVRLYESSDGITWNALQLVENGGSFEYTQKYLMAEAVLLSNGISFGTPSIQDIEIQVYEDENLQIGEDATNEHRLLLSPVDARTSAIGISDVDIRYERKALKQYLDQSDWGSGLGSITDVDYVTRPGYVQLAAPINNQPAPVAQVAGANNVYFAISALQRADGLFDVTMTMQCYGHGNATGYEGFIDVFNGDGSRANFTHVVDQSVDGLPPVGWPIPGGTNSYRDVNYADTNGNLAYDAGIDERVKDGQPANPNELYGTYPRIFFDYGTGGLNDGVSFDFTCDAEAYINVNLDVTRQPNHNKTGEDTMDIYFQDQQVADDVDGVPGNFNFTRRLSEYVPSASPPVGQFETNAFFFGGGFEGTLMSTGFNNNPGDAVQFEIYESSDGVTAWNKILDRGAGTSFVTGTGKDFIYVKTYLEGSDAVWSSGPGNGAYFYTPSATPRVDDLMVTKDISPITEFQMSLKEVNDLRRELGVQSRRLYHIIDDLNAQRINILSAKSTLQDADMAVEAAQLAKQQILTDTTTAVKAQGDPFLEEILNLQREHDVGRHEIRQVFGGE